MKAEPLKGKMRWLEHGYTVNSPSKGRYEIFGKESVAAAVKWLVKNMQKDLDWHFDKWYAVEEYIQKAFSDVVEVQKDG